MLGSFSFPKLLYRVLPVLAIYSLLPKVRGLYSTVTDDTPGTALGVKVSGQRAYVADGASGIRVLNINNPSAPFYIGTFSTGEGLLPNYAKDVQCALVGSYDTPGDSKGVKVVGDLAFVADWTSGLQIINISNPHFCKWDFKSGSCFYRHGNK